MRLYFIKVVLLVVAVQILNLSVYGKSFHTSELTNESNQIDSMVEYLAEVVLDFKNVFPENGSTHNHQTHTNHQLKHESIKLVNVRKNAEVKAYCATVIKTYPVKEDYKYLFAREINPPPPKA